MKCYSKFEFAKKILLVKLDNFLNFYIKDNYKLKFENFNKKEKYISYFDGCKIQSKKINNFYNKIDLFKYENFDFDELILDIIDWTCYYNNNIYYVKKNDFTYSINNLYKEFQRKNKVGFLILSKNQQKQLIEPLLFRNDIYYQYIENDCVYIIPQKDDLGILYIDLLNQIAGVLITDECHKIILE